ncbi:MAG: glycosyltransferase family 2 protein [Akkermansiaceae bacterium]|nr:glycosyltransferase family 2 protein [Akkermansiaceae bacterium]
MLSTRLNPINFFVFTKQLTRVASIIIQQSSPAISVVMPCFNSAHTVRRAIESIQTQSITSWELIVVDDGSTDSSAEIVASMAKNDLRIRFIRTPHGGVVSASNYGFSLAKADVIARMDSDDVSLPTRLETQLKLLEKSTHLSAVTCLAEFAGNVSISQGYAHHVAWTNRHITSDEIALNRFIDLPFPHPTLMYRRELVTNLGGYRDGDFPEDYEMILRWINAGVKIGKVNKLLYKWYDPATRLSRNDPRYNPMAFHHIKAPYLANAIIASGCGNKELWIWGAGRPARKCAEPLEQSWNKASGFIDIDPRKIGQSLHGRQVVSPTNLPPAEQAVIVSYVGTRGARDVIRADLLASNRKEGVDFWIAC